MSVYVVKLNVIKKMYDYSYKIEMETANLAQRNWIFKKCLFT